MWEGGRSWLSLICGVLLIALGIIPLIGSLTGFNLPEFMTGIVGQIAIYIIAAAGLYLIIDMFLEWGEDWAWISMVAGVIFLGLGVVGVLNQFGVLNFGDIIKTYLTNTVYNIIFVIEGIALAIGAFYMT